MTLAHAGCRLSEALALTVDRVDFAAGVLVFATLKKRQPGIYRVAYPCRLPCSVRSTGRMTGWRAVHSVMEAAGLDGPQASPKGLRHGFDRAIPNYGNDRVWDSNG